MGTLTLSYHPCPCVALLTVGGVNRMIQMINGSIQV